MTPDEDTNEESAKEFARIATAIGTAILCRDMVKQDRNDLIALAKDDGIDAALELLHGMQRELLRNVKVSKSFRREGRIMKHYRDKCSSEFAESVRACRAACKNG